MLDALISGKLIRDPITREGASGKPFCSFLLSVHTGDEQPVIVSGIAFGDIAERIDKLKKGDALAVIGMLKPSSWTDKTTGETKNGLSVTVSACLSVYDVTKRRKKSDTIKAESKTTPGFPESENSTPDYDDPIDF